MFKYLSDRHLAAWNALVPASWNYLREDATHFHFIHPTKGPRRLSKSRLPNLL